MLLAAAPNGKEKEPKDWQGLKVVRSELEIKNLNLKYLFGLFLSAKVRNTNSQSADVLFCGGEKMFYSVWGPESKWIPGLD